MTHTQTLIIGGGIVGATLAIKLAQAKRTVTLIDAQSPRTAAEWHAALHQRDARVYALSKASIALLEEVGVWQPIVRSARKADYSQMQVWQRDGRGELRFGDDSDTDTDARAYSTADTATTMLGTVDHQAQETTYTHGHEHMLLGSMVEPLVIEHAIWQRLQDADVAEYLKLFQGHQVTHMDWLGTASGYRVQLAPNDPAVDDSTELPSEGRQTIEATLVVGADGRGSFVREHVGIGAATLDYQQTAICCAIKTQKPHRAIARQLMLPTGTLALLPLADISDEDKAEPQHWQSVVWTLPRNRALELLAEPPSCIARELAAASLYELGDIEHIESIASFPLSAMHATTYVLDNLVLIGDAAHGVHPLAGQGLNLGMLDVQALYDELMHEYRRSGHASWGSTQTLRAYERRRRPHNSLMMHSFSALNWLFAGELAQLRPIQQLRGEGVYRVGKIKPLMDFFAKQASGT